MCTLVVAVLCSPGASHREKGSMSDNFMDTGREDTFFKINFSYRGRTLSPLTCNTYTNP